jgi:hypothetical protein
MKSFMTKQSRVSKGNKMNLRTVVTKWFINYYFKSNYLRKKKLVELGIKDQDKEKREWETFFISMGFDLKDDEVINTLNNIKLTPVSAFVKENERHFLRVRAVTHWMYKKFKVIFLRAS